MKKTEAIEILEKHNKWRRGDETVEPVNVMSLGIAIDTLLEFAKSKQESETFTEVVKCECGHTVPIAFSVTQGDYDTCMPCYIEHFQQLKQ